MTATTHSTECSAPEPEHQNRILRPDWELVERHLQRPAPSALRELYAERSLVTAQDLRYANDEAISTFEALDEQGLDAWKSDECDGLVIATTGFGDPIYLRTGPAEADTVSVTRHDGGDTEVFAESLSEMLGVLRHANAPSERPR